MAFINRLPVDDTTGRAVVSDTAPAGADPYLAGIRFTADGTTLYILTGSVPTDAAFQDGFARDASTGRLCALIDDPPSAPNRFYNDGVLGDASGHMCMTAINAIDHYMHGWPLDAIGQVCIAGGGPPPPVTFNKVVFPAQFRSEETLFIGQLYFGTSGTGTGYTTDKTAFLAAHPGLTLQDFSGIAPPGGEVPAPAFSGFTITPDGAAQVADSATFSTPFCILHLDVSSQTMTLTFSPAVSAVGFNALDDYTDVLIQFYNGATLLSAQTLSTPIDFSGFAGYST